MYLGEYALHSGPKLILHYLHALPCCVSEGKRPVTGLQLAETSEFLAALHDKGLWPLRRDIERQNKECVVVVVVEGKVMGLPRERLLIWVASPCLNTLSHHYPPDGDAHSRLSGNILLALALKQTHTLFS